MAAPTAELSTLPPRLETLLEITRQLSAFLPLEKLLGKMAEACGSLLDSDSVGIRVVEGDELVLMGVWGDAQTAMPNARIKIGESLTGTVVATGEPLLLSDPANDPRIAPASRVAYLRGGYRAFLGVPLKIGEQVLGALSIRTLRAEGFSSEDVSIATAFAAQAAIALENARLYREAEARADKLKALSALTRLMTSAEGASEVCQAVARAAPRRPAARWRSISRTRTCGRPTSNASGARSGSIGRCGSSTGRGCGRSFAATGATASATAVRSSCGSSSACPPRSSSSPCRSRARSR